MNLRNIFQSIIALHQEEIPLSLHERSLQLPLNKQRIVTVTGVRRCGKSSLLHLTINRLLASGVDKEQILYIGFDDERLANMDVSDFDEILQAYRLMYPDRPLSSVYMFFDEIQIVKGWELFVLRVYKSYCKNVYVTGSTAQMLSGEMSSALRGWPDEYTEYPLSFKEFIAFKGVKANRYTEEGAALMANMFKSYLLTGGFPQAVLANVETERVKLLQAYFNTMLFRDMIEHYNISASPSVVRYFLKRVFNNITKPSSVNNIYNDLKSQGLKLSKDSLYQWLDYACNIFLLHKVPKYSKSIIKQSTSLSKYYVVDFALAKSVLLPQSEEKGKALENAVYMHLARHLNENEQIYYFNEGAECDFVIANDEGVKELIQVCWELDEFNTPRECGGLCAASAATGCKKASIITCNQAQSIHYGDLQINVVAAWDFML
ncbi:ATP-binding protein [Prevotellamassilia timonensis]|jgi:predicted AAA+ superfamily ATPase|uniref:ATP-binding protein n=1 Tax=Prevotellamassilia timonensis TaxID=1852370 RepID=UPI003076EED7